MTNGFGILGGSFDPIHFGHLRCAEEIRQRFSLEKVIFIPTYAPPHKPPESVLEYRHRKAMVRAALGSNPHFILEDIEERLPVPSYTSRTIQAVVRKYGGGTDFCFILGDDDFSSMGAWHSPSEIFRQCDVIVITRHAAGRTLQQLLPVDLKDEFWYPEREGVLVHKQGKKVYLSSIPMLDISSSRIRSFVKQRLSVRYLTTDPVIEYIDKERLYY
ncbi:MAG: nicotinate (nicotinamide) nucleotide adenylyltransferase [Deltaproteobacteria bacterium]|nr:nicotinate (nicotinamide) nucleotide adenylyltransferase [Deltaproteobacteria bacterium]MCL5277513.1 nicotinate (nicotinamide) nucleotide adenylyltransferase [Deltaproteobacteria bacterium]